MLFFFFQAEDGIRDQPRSRGLGDVYKRQLRTTRVSNPTERKHMVGQILYRLLIVGRL